MLLIINIKTPKTDIVPCTLMEGATKKVFPPTEEFGRYLPGI